MFQKLIHKLDNFSYFAVRVYINYIYIQLVEMFVFILKIFLWTGTSFFLYSKITSIVSSLTFILYRQTDEDLFCFIPVLLFVVLVWDTCPIGECWRGIGPTIGAYFIETDFQTGWFKVFCSLQCRLILVARVHIFVLGRHLGFSNYGGLGRGDIRRGSRG